MSCNEACGANYYQGDQYSFIFKIEQCEAPLDLEGVVLIEFTVGALSKQWPTEVTYDEDQKVFLSLLHKKKPLLWRTTNNTKLESNTLQEMFMLHL